MIARRTEPTTRTHLPGIVWLRNGRKGLMTCSGLVIGRHYVPKPPAQDQGTSADRVQDLLLWGRPLWQTQRYVTAMCVAERRP